MHPELSGRRAPAHRRKSPPREHWTRLRTNNSLERIMKEIRRRTRVVGAFPDGNSALMLVGARLRHITTTKWGTKPYLATCNLYEEDVL